MQTLQAGSFLTLENAETVENLKFTARLLAEHTEKMVKENLQPAPLENLANNLWQKAEYVTRETERRRLQQIFVENFTERFRELKLDFDALNARIIDSFNQANAPEKVEVESEPVTTQANVSPEEQSSKAQSQKDEFLGLVNPGEPETQLTVEETETATAAPQESTESAAPSEAVKQENECVTTVEATVPESHISQKAESAAVNNSADKIRSTAQNDSRASNQVKTGTQSLDAKEPFEFGKCTVNLNLVLLPCSGNEASRKVIVSCASHTLPPEIEYLEIEMSENLEMIAGVVKDKLSRFRGTLPVKYIEQLRASKPGATKTNREAKQVTTAEPAEKSRRVEEKTSGEQNAQSIASFQSEAKDSEQTAERTAETASIVSPPVASGERVQPSLF